MAFPHSMDQAEQRKSWAQGTAGAGNGQRRERCMTLRLFLLKPPVSIALFQHLLCTEPCAKHTGVGQGP